MVEEPWYGGNGTGAILRGHGRRPWEEGMVGGGHGRRGAM